MEEFHHFFTDFIRVSPGGGGGFRHISRPRPRHFRGRLHFPSFFHRPWHLCVQLRRKFGRRRGWAGGVGGFSTGAGGGWGLRECFSGGASFVGADVPIRPSDCITELDVKKIFRSPERVTFCADRKSPNGPGHPLLPLRGNSPWNCQGWEGFRFPSPL